MPENKHLRFFVTLIYIALGLFLLWFVFKYALGWIAPFIVAFILSRLIDWPVTFCTNKLHIPRAISSGVFTIVAFGGVGTGLYFLVSRIIREIRQFVTTMPDASVIISQVTDFLDRASSSFLGSVSP
ncbi:MAG: hypothetical protein RSA70_07730, partial [Clostridia bacterium]